MCGEHASRILKIVLILKSCTRSCDVLADESVRMGIKEFSDWPTIPQLYVDGEFVGGSDIMLEMYQKGESAPLRAKSVPCAPSTPTRAQASSRK